jgi:PAS domain S-box-containing protein
MEIGQRIGQRIRTARKHAGLTQKQLAEYLGKSGAAVAYLEQGKRRANAEVLMQVSKATSKPLSFFYEEESSTELTFSRRMDMLQREVFEIQKLLKTEQDRRKSAEDDVYLFRELFDQSNDQLLVWDGDTGKAVTCNQAVLEHLECEREELLEKTIMQVEPGIPTLDVWHKIVGDLKSNGVTIMRTEPKRKDGTSFHVEVSVKYVLLDDHPYVVSAARNITERDFHFADGGIHHLHQYSSLLNDLVIPVLICDNAGKLISANEGFRKQFSITQELFSLEDVSALSFPAFTEAIEKCRKTGESSDLVVDIDFKDGSKSYCVRMQPFLERSYITQVVMVFQPVV